MEKEGRERRFSLANIKDYFLNAKTDQKSQRTIILITSAILTVVIVVVAYFGVSYAFFKPVSMFDDSPVVVTIKRGTSLNAISKDLEAKGIVRNASVFKLYVDFSDYSSKIRSGTYDLNKTMSMREIARELTKGGVSESETSVTIPEGMSVEEIAQRLKDAGVIQDAESFQEECNNIDNYLEYPFIAALKDKSTGKRYVLEGYLFPDTYMFFTDSTNEEIINRMLNRFNQVYSQEWIEKTGDLGLTVDQVVAIAAMIEKEAKTQDFSKVSAVFHNRLKKKMRMDADSTVQYARNIKRLALTDEDTAVDSPFNTYKFTGLPPGGICSPGKAALQAALNPDEDYTKGGYLYFCTKDPESGELIFSKTQEEHNRYVAEYRPRWIEYDQKNSGK